MSALTNVEIAAALTWSISSDDPEEKFMDDYFQRWKLMEQALILAPFPEALRIAEGFAHFAESDGRDSAIALAAIKLAINSGQGARDAAEVISAARHIYGFLSNSSGCGQSSAALPSAPSTVARAPQDVG